METASRKERKMGLLLFVLVAVGFGALFLCESVLEYDVGRLFNPCGFKQRTQLPCITCGWTTATRALVRGDIGQAITAQPAAVMVNLLIAVGALIGLALAVTGRIPRPLVRLYRDLKWWQMLAALTVVLLAGWGVTLATAFAQ